MSKPIHTYVDLDVINNDTSSNNESPLLKFIETRNIPYLEGDSSEYFCSIIRFSIQTGNSLPVFIPRIELGQTDPNKTVYKMSCKCTSGSTPDMIATVNVIYQPTNNTISAAAPPISKQDLSNDYYYVYNYRDFIDDLNAACKSLYTATANAIPYTTLKALFNTSVAPFFDFDYDTMKVILNVDKKWIDGIPDPSLGGTPLKFNFYFNKRLYELLTGFRCTYENSTGDLNYRLTLGSTATDIQPELTNSRLVSYTQNSVTTSYTAMQFYQEISSIGMWNPIASIAFCTSMIPIKPTNTSAAKDASDTSNTNLIGGGSNNLTNILSDFEVNVTPDNQYRPEILYAPQAEYRMVDLNSSFNLNKIDISVYWKTKFAEFIPMRLSAGCAASLKVMFRHKSYNMNYY